jgi:hypothetical protein
MLEAFLNSLEPDPAALLSAISKHITDDMLAEIAEADYGRDPERQVEALRQIRDHGTFVEPMCWYPCEVLELIRNSQPEDPGWKPGATGVRGHWMRAFACAALFHALDEPWRYKGDAAKPGYTLIQLIASFDTLGVDFTRETVRLVAWLMLDSGLEGQDEQVVYFGVGMLWLLLHLSNPPSDTSLIHLAEWIVRREEELAMTLRGSFDRWLLGVGGSSPPPSPWESLGDRLCTLDLSGHRLQLQEWVQLIGSNLAE